MVGIAHVRSGLRSELDTLRRAGVLPAYAVLAGLLGAFLVYLVLRPARAAATALDT